jgi:hypothetical protein
VTRRSSTAAGIARRLAGAVLVVGAFASGQPARWTTAAARADVIYELAPSVGAGATDNARLASGTEQHYGDAFSIVGGSARVRYNGARVVHGVGYRGTYTRYFETEGNSSFANQLALTSSFQLSSLWTLDLAANGSLLRTSGLDPNDPAVVFQQGAVGGSTLYLTAGALQRAAYVPTPRRLYDESLTVTQLRYLESMRNGVAVDMPTTTVLMLTLRGIHQVGREAFSVESFFADSIIDTDTPAGRGPFATGHVFLGRALAGWKHELSPVWYTMLQAGPAVIFKLDGNGVMAPAGAASINYASVPWLASLTVSQTPAPNLYLGAATLSDQVMARFIIPLTRNELLYVGGFGGYVYARVADASQNMTRAYDQFIGSASVILRFTGTRLVAAATYTALSQRGSDVPGYAVNDLARQTVLITLRGELAWGPGTPPLFGGPL